MKKLLTRDLLLQRQVLEIEEVDLGNDEIIHVRQMTGRERDIFEQSLVTEIKDSEGKTVNYGRSLEDFRAKLCVMVICNPGGDLVLRPEDYPLLSQSMSAKRLEKIVNVAQRLNKITEDDKKELLKNSEAAPQDNSSSNSVEN